MFVYPNIKDDEKKKIQHRISIQLLMLQSTISNNNKYQKVVFHHRVYRDTRGQYKSHSCMEQTLVIVINSYQSRSE